MAALIRGLADYEGLEAQFFEEELGEHLFGGRPYAEALLLFEDGEAVGLAVFFHSYSTFEGRPGVWLEDLFVREEHRGRGHGSALLAAVAAVAVERRCARLEWSALDWNESAIGFYLGLGAQQHGGWQTFRLEGDALGAVASRR